MRALPLFFMAAAGAFAQDAKRQFEVASVKISTAGPPPQGRMSMSGGAGTRDPSRITFVNWPLNQILIWAFDIKDYQFIAPSWLADVRVDISARVPDGTTFDQEIVMTQNLIIERFGAKIHRDTRDLLSYDLVAAKSGLKMKESDLSIPPPVETKTETGRPQLASVKAPDGLPILAPGRKAMWTAPLGPGRIRISSRMQPMAEIRRMCEQHLKHPVVDKTGLTGIYDFYIDFSPPGYHPPSADSSSTPVNPVAESFPPFEVALESLGLHLESKKQPIEVVVIDRLNKTPTEN